MLITLPCVKGLTLKDILLEFVIVPQNAPTSPDLGACDSAPLCIKLD